MKKSRVIIIAVLLAAIFATTTYASFVSASSISELKEQQEEADQKVDELEAEKKKLQDSLGDLNSELQKVSASIRDLEDKIALCEAQIDQAQKELEEAEASAEEQYEQMKLRIQFMYENSSTGLFTTMLEARNFTDLLNRASYISELSNYDRKKLDEYEATMESISAYKATLEENQEELLAAQTDLEKQQKALLADISEKKSDIAAASENIEEQEKKKAKLADEIAAMEEYERKLAEKKAKEEAARLAALKKQQEEAAKAGNSSENSAGTGAINHSPVTVSDSELELLAALIYCEAGGESYEAQVAVGSVVLNRMDSSYFPNTMTGVIYQSGQFTPAASGKLALVLDNGLTTASCRQAASQVLAGNRNGSWLYFCLNYGGIDGKIGRAHV